MLHEIVPIRNAPILVSFWRKFFPRNFGSITNTLRRDSFAKKSVQHRENR